MMLLAGVINTSGLGIDYQAILPEIIVVATLLVVLLLDLVVPPDRRGALALLTVIGLVASLIANMAIWGQTRSAFGDTVAGDSYAAFFNFLIVAVSIATVLLSPRFLRMNRLNYGEYYVLLLGATGGMMLLAAATSLMTIFLGIELLSIALYVLSSFARTDLRSQEAGLKYLLLGGFASGFLLYGMALIYGATGSTGLRAIAAYAAGQAGATVASNVILLLGIGFLTVGLGFKVSAAPFHMWTPDVYEGSPTVVTTFMSVATKAAAFAAFGRVFIAAFPALRPQWTTPLVLVAMASLCVGNIVAVVENNLKRMLAYSGIAHAGFILLGFAAGTQDGLRSALFYLAAYAVMNFGAFAIITLVAARGEATNDISYWRGLFYRQPLLATAMTILLLSLAGFPPTIGFFAKLFVLRSLILSAQSLSVLWWGVLIAVVTTVVSFYYYLRVVVAMLTPAEGAAVEQERAGFWGTAIALVTSIGSVVLGIISSVILDWANQASQIRL